MYLLTIRAAVVILAAFVVAVVTAGVVLSTGSLWQAAALSAGPAFGFSVMFFNAIIPPAQAKNDEDQQAR
ncbi:hypothetical protein [Herbidospora mongoliensis]|uniref:hypothetical protein n=1 Tax=Herbidospora mongoliensis TaxID=688067 RepID=UPI000833AB4B|nr:hypothetical protein [Herbidospora mongoliensis]